MCISAIVLTKNSQDTLEPVLERLRPLVDEVVLVDGGSTDKTLEIAKKYADKILYDEGKGLGYAREIGRRNCSCEYIATVDSDAVVNPMFFEKAVALMDNDSAIGGLSSKIVPIIDNPKNAIEKFQIWNIAIQSQLKYPEYPHPVQGLNCTITLYRAEALEKVAGFDTRMKLCLEDGTISHRLTEARFKLYYLPIISQHLERASHFKVNRKYGKGWKTYRKYYPKYAKFGRRYDIKVLAHIIPVFPFLYWIYRYIKLYWKTPLRKEILTLSLMETWRHIEILRGLFEL